MGVRKQLDYTQVKGVRVTFTKNPYGDKLDNILCFPLYITKNEKGEKVAYYFDEDGWDGDIYTLQRRNIMVDCLVKSGIVLVDVLPSYLPRLDTTFVKLVDRMSQSCETDVDMSGKYSEESYVKVFSTNEYRTNGYFS